MHTTTLFIAILTPVGGVVRFTYEGRLGNEMFEAAAAIGVATAHNTTACATNAGSLSDVFVGPFPPRCGMFGWMTAEAVKEVAYARFTMPSRSNIRLQGYRQSWRYFETIAPKVREMFQFRRPVARSSLFRGAVGIHVRRGDYTQAQHGHLRIPPTTYFEHAMRQYPAERYYVASDDTEWCKRQAVFKDPRVRFLNGTPARDMAALAACDHVIQSIGTFGWWAAWLSNRTSVYYRDMFDPGHPTNRMIVPADYFYPPWTALGPQPTKYM